MSFFTWAWDWAASLNQLKDLFTWLANLLRRYILVHTTRIYALLSGVQTPVFFQMGSYTNTAEPALYLMSYAVYYD